MKTTTLDGERYFLLADVLLLLTGEPRTRRNRLYSKCNERYVDMIDPDSPLIRRRAISAAGVRELCAKLGKGGRADEVLTGETVDPFQHLSEPQKERIRTLSLCDRGSYREVVLLKGGPQCLTDRERLDLLCEKAHLVLVAFFREEGEAAVRDAMKGMQEAVGLTEGPRA